MRLAILRRLKNEPFDENIASYFLLVKSVMNVNFSFCALGR